MGLLDAGQARHFLAAPCAPRISPYLPRVSPYLPQARRSLAALARLHAFFWEGGAFSTSGGEAAAELEAAVWPAGMYTQPSMQPAAQFDRLGHVHDMPETCPRHVP